MGNRGNKAFIIYLIGQGFSNLGDSVRFIAVTMHIYNLSGSGIDTAYGIALSSLASIIFSGLAGALGDKFNERRLLLLADFIKFITIPLFLSADSIAKIYLLLVAMALYDVFYGPSRKKLILSMTGRRGAVKANSLLTGVSGAAYLIGPLASGALMDKYGPAPAILASSLCCFASWILTVITGVVWSNNDSRGTPGSSLPSSVSEGLKYCLSTPEIRQLILLGVVVGFSSISVNLAFYPFAFDTLNVTAKGWGLMISVYYGANVIAMLIVKGLQSIYERRTVPLICMCLIIVSAAWMLYSFGRRYWCVLLLQMIEGIAISLFGIFASAAFQIRTQKSFMARVAGINDIFSSIGKVGGIITSAFLIERYSFNAIFVFNAILLFLFASAHFIRVQGAGLNNISSKY